MDRAYTNMSEGVVACCWNADNKEDVIALFEKAGAPYERITLVEEQSADAFST
jgi:hypothetical protein